MINWFWSAVADPTSLLLCFSSLLISFAFHYPTFFHYFTGLTWSCWVALYVEMSISQPFIVKIKEITVVNLCCTDKFNIWCYFGYKRWKSDINWSDNNSTVMTLILNQNKTNNKSGWLHMTINMCACYYWTHKFWGFVQPWYKSAFSEFSRCTQTSEGSFPSSLKTPN